MKKLHLFLAAIGALILLGCGGSNNGTQTFSGNPASPSTPRVEAVLRSDPSVVVDPQDIETGDEIVFELVNYTGSPGNLTRNVLSPVTWRSSDVNSNFGNLASNSGLYLAGDQPMASRAIVGGTFAGTEYSGFYQIHSREVRLSGVVQDENTNAPIGGITLQFYDGDNNLVGQVTSAFDGTFRASIPVSAVSFQVSPDSVGLAYYPSYTFDGLRYDASDAACRAPLPGGLEVGPAALDAPVLVTPRVAGQPAPDPTGCS